MASPYYFGDEAWITQSAAAPPLCLNLDMATAAMQTEVRQPTSAGLFRSSGKRRAVLSLLLTLLTLAVYNPVARNDFVNYDDIAYVTGNRHVQSGLTWATVKWSFRSREAANWHPLTWLSHALDCGLFHLKPAGHHYTSLLLHALAAVLLFLFLHEMTGLAGRSAVVAALFAVHPVNVESVAWVSERKNVLCTVFFLLGLWAYSRYARQPSLKRYVAVFFAFALGLMSKPMVITFPFVLLLLDYWPLGRLNFAPEAIEDNGALLHCKPQPWRRLVLEKLPLLALSVASAVVTIIVQKEGGALREQFTFSARAANIIVSYSLYIGKAIWPTRLAAIYPFPMAGLPWWKVVGSSVLVVAITATVLIRKRNRYLAVGWFWFLGTLVPTIGLVQVGEQAMADRYAYIPFIGLFVAAIWGIADWAASKRMARWSLALAAVLAIAGLSMATRKQIGYWQNSITLWTHALQVTDRNFVAEDNLGAELGKLGRTEEAKRHFQVAVDLNPRDAFSQLNLGVCEKRLGNAQAAVEHYRAALRLSADPTLRSSAFGNLGSFYRSSGNYALARENYAAALKIDPEKSLPLIGLGVIAQKTGDLRQAVDFYSRAVKVEPSDAEYLLLAQALTKAGRASEAQAAYGQAQKISRDWNATEQAVNHLLQE
jgi:protein O-mannosyl-transferase